MQEPPQALHVREHGSRCPRKLADFLLWFPKMESAASHAHPGETKTRDSTTRGHRILVCVDRTKPADACLAYSIVLARALGSDLTLVHVMQPHGHVGPHPDALDWEISRQEARAYLEQLEEDAVRALKRPAELRLEQGRAAERIVELAREIAADLTVLGTNSDRGGTAWNLGSTVQQIVTASRGSVLIAPVSAPIAASPQRIIVPLDGSQRTESVLPTAARIANAYGAELILLHVTQELLPTPVLHSGEDLELASRLASRLKITAKAYLEGLRARLVRDGARVRTLVMHHANQRHCIVEAAKREHADLIAVAAHGAACDPARTFGTVTEYLLAHSTVPLLVLQDLPDTDLHTPELGDTRAPPLRASYPPECV
jgi:nucleotide-binding universal stress UspA family protein